MLHTIRRAAGLTVRHHLWGSLAIVLFIAMVISTQITDRSGFANGELHRDVMDRWGTPIVQPVPSVRFVESGAIFNTLEALALDSQQVVVEADMSYRKRGLVYFSGFDFGFRGRYGIHNPEPHDIEVVFVFPIQVESNRVLLSDLEFSVDGQPEPIDLAESSDKLVWTGRLTPGEKRRFEIAFRGRGLDSFLYRLDPDLPVREFDLTMTIRGGDNFDYADGVVPATQVERTEDTTSLQWRYASLESGVPVGVILPSEKSFDAIIETMLRRAWATFLMFFGGLALLAVALRRELRFYEAYLLSAGFGFFYVLLPYLAAYLHFYVAYAVALVLVFALLSVYLQALLGASALRPALGLLVAFLGLPTLAVVIRAHTGLIYTLEIAVGLAVLMALSSRASFQDAITTLTEPLSATGTAAVAATNTEEEIDHA